jgi:hypothetical protein
MTGITLDTPTTTDGPASRAGEGGAFVTFLRRSQTPAIFGALIWGAAVAYVLVLAALGPVVGNVRPARADVIDPLIFLLMWGAATPAILRSAWWLPIARPHVVRRMLLHLVLASAFVLAINLAGPFLLRLSLGIPIDPGETLLAGVRTFARLFHLALIVYAFILGAGHYMRTQGARRAEAERSATLSMELAEARVALQLVARAADASAADASAADDPAAHSPASDASVSRASVSVGSRRLTALRCDGDERRHGEVPTTHAAYTAQAASAASAAQTVPMLPSASAPLAIKEEGRLRLVEQTAIDWIEADDDHVVVHAGPATFRSRETLRDVERRLDSSLFVRIHRSTIVQMSRIRELEPWFRGDYVVVLQSGMKLRLSRNHRARLASVIGRRL